MAEDHSSERYAVSVERVPTFAPMENVFGGRKCDDRHIFDPQNVTIAQNVTIVTFWAIVTFWGSKM